MRTEQHEAIARWERRWLALMGGLLVVLVVLMGYSLYLEGGHIGRRSQGGTPAELGFLYLPLLWRGVHYDTLASLGA